jgi:large subunit ribosomal protein L10
VRDLGLTELEELLIGPTAIAFVGTKPDGTSADAVDVAKALRDFARTNPALVVKGGLLGERSLTAAEARALADVESREVLLSKLAGAMAAPLQQMAGLLQALPRNMAYGLSALLDERGGAPEVAAPIEAEPTETEPPAAEPTDATEAEPTETTEAAHAAETETTEAAVEAAADDTES